MLAGKFITGTPERRECQRRFWFFYPRSAEGFIGRVECFDCLALVLTEDPADTRFLLTSVRDGLFPVGKPAK